MTRETPLHTGHLRSMTQLSEMGAIIAPPVPAFYPRPQTLNDMIDHTIGRVLDLFDIDARLVHRWKAEESSDPAQDGSATGSMSKTSSHRGRPDLRRLS
jgi:4-hydroxy-3-polyprenylbenzoate decarboxylase